MNEIMEEIKEVLIDCVRACPNCADCRRHYECRTCNSFNKIIERGIKKIANILGYKLK